jgi:O-antigen ligase
MIICYLLEQDDYLKKYLLYFFYFILLCVAINTLKQFFFGIDFFQNSKPFMRLTDFNGSQKIGAFLSRFMPVFILVFIYSHKKLNFFFHVVNLFFLVLILFSGERIAFIQYLIFLLLFYFFFINKFKEKMIIFTSIFLLLFLIFSIDEKIRTRYITQTVAQFFGTSFDSATGKLKENIDVNEIFLFSETHQTHYETAYKMFLDKKLIGHGVKMFRHKCKNNEYFINSSSCTTHPHNFILQFLAEIGIFGFLFLFFAILYIYYKISFIIIQKLFFKISVNQYKLLIPLLSFAVIYFPFFPSGNFFSNWLLISKLYILGFFIYEEKKFKR